MKTVSVLFLLLLITACSHPLQISGEGDIISSNGKHNCFLEEQPCDNFVTGDYAVTYTAEPREGWSFDTWEGCAGQFPECTFDVPASAVSENWGEVMPPLKATFSRDPPRNRVLIIFDNSGSMNIIASDDPDKTRLEVAKNVVSSVINTYTSIDFGLATFNHNYDGQILGFYSCNGTFCPVFNSEGDHGGRIIKHLKENMTDAERAELAGPAGIIDSITASGSTPLNESTYEVYRYLAGLSPLYGLKQDIYEFDFWAGYDSYLDSPDYDPDAFAADLSTYNSPIANCASTHVILMTDGFPSLDDDANDKIESEFGVTCPDFATDGGGIAKSCLAEVTRYMANNDLDGDASNGDQYGITHTIEFHIDQLLLQNAATNGKGQYFTANSEVELANAFHAIIENISNTPSSCE